MTASFRAISSTLARSLMLVMTDVDGTLSADGAYFDPAVADLVGRLQADGIVVGLVSGRTVPRLEFVAETVGARGPLIAENGGVAKLAPKGALIDLGYSRRPALEALAMLKAVFPGPGAIFELTENMDRLVDVTILSDGVACEEMVKHVPGIQLLDSGYMIHLMPQGISKAGTLLQLLPRVGGGMISPDQVLVCGDSPTDLSLFKAFRHSVRILNPRLPPGHLEVMRGAAAYDSDLAVEQGFVQVAEHIIRARLAL